MSVQQLTGHRLKYFKHYTDYTMHHIAFVFTGGILSPGRDHYEERPETYHSEEIPEEPAIGRILFGMRDSGMHPHCPSRPGGGTV